MAEMNRQLDHLKQLISSGNTNDEIVIEFCRSVTKSDATLLEMIQLVGDDLQDTDLTKRSVALSFIKQLIELLIPYLPTSGKTESLLAEFFCSKLKDHHTLLPTTLSVLEILSSSRNLTDGTAILIVQSVFQEVHCQSQLQNDRKKIYAIFKNLLTYKLKEMQLISQDYVFGFIQAMDQERDPRNLLILFSIIPTIAKYLKLEPFVEEFFEVFSCYFPIDFTAPSDDPNGVTREQLVEGLRKCMASNAQFAEYCLPLLHSKLESNVTSAKIDAWRTLEECSDSYRASDLENWIELFLNLARKELLVNINESEVEHAILDALTSLTSLFASTGLNENATFTKIIKEVVNECKVHVCEPERRLMTPSLNILLAICAGSQYASKFIIDEVIPLLLNQYQTRSEPTSKQFILNALNRLVDTHLRGYTEKDDESAISKWVEASFLLYMNVLVQEKDVTMLSLGLKGLMSNLPLTIKLPEWEKMNHLIVSILFNHPEESISKDIHRFFSLMSSYNSNFMEQILDELLQPIENGYLHRKAALSAVNHLHLSYDLICGTVSKLYATLEAIHDHEIESDILQAIAALFSNRDNFFTIDVDIFWRLHSWVFERHVQYTTDESLLVLSSASKAFRTIASSFDRKVAISMANELLEFYASRHELVKSCHFVVLIMESTLGWLDAPLEGSALMAIISTLQSVAFDNSHIFVRETACRFSAALINKMPEGQNLDKFVDDLSVSVDHANDSIRSNAVLYFLWIVKGLVLRAYSKMNVVIQKLITFLSINEIKVSAAEGFALVLRDTPECLNMQSHANIKLLYRQRFFQQTVPKLLKAYDHSQNPLCFTAIANQLPFVPQGILVSQAPILIPMMIRCLSQEQESSVIIAIMKALMGLSSENNESFINYVDTLIPRLLILGKRGRTMDIRKLALKFLGQLSSVSKLVLLKLRSEVIFQLIPCLDDKKRLVRREAALTRQKWIMLGQPGGLQPT